MLDQYDRERYSRSGRPEVFCKKGVLENFKPTTLLKKRLWDRCFPVNFAKFSRTLVFQRTPPVAASGIAYSVKYIRFRVTSCHPLHDISGKTFVVFILSLNASKDCHKHT